MESTMMIFDATPTFGNRLSDVDYTPRRAAYGVIFDGNGAVAVVSGRAGWFLPGGGSMENETFDETLLREIREELGQEARIISEIGEAMQYFEAVADGLHYEMVARFFLAELVGEPFAIGEHELCWLDPLQLDEAFYHQCHLWAVREASRIEHGG
jgi:8-oxo-dGTP pyrophosphatase MutT (NUDIX family)